MTFLFRFMVVLYIAIALDFFINGASLLTRAKEYDLMTYLFYDDPYCGIRLWDLSNAPRWVSILLGFVYIVVAILFAFMTTRETVWLREQRTRNKKEEKQKTPSLNLDPILSTDKEWITEIKTRKQKGEKLNAYSKDGAIAARRKARVLGVEECFVKFLSEEEVRERRGW